MFGETCTMLCITDAISYRAKISGQVSSVEREVYWWDISDDENNKVQAESKSNGAFWNLVQQFIIVSSSLYASC